MLLHGQVIAYEGPWVVVNVNESRATIQPLPNNWRELSEVEVNFNTVSGISPNSEVDVIGYMKLKGERVNSYAPRKPKPVVDKPVDATIETIKD